MKENNFTFYVNKFFMVKEAIDKENLSFIPMLLRRRMNDFDKFTSLAINGVFDENVENIVFSSSNGQVKRLRELISQYLGSKEVSPSLFSGSVHNYSAGLYLLFKQKSIPYTCLSSFENSISLGLLSAVISKYNNVLFVYSDCIEEKNIAFGLNISKSKGESRYLLTLKDNGEIKDKNEDFENLFSGVSNVLKTKMFNLEYLP